jgi:hypothetical protein
MTGPNKYCFATFLLVVVVVFALKNLESAVGFQSVDKTIFFIYAARKPYTEISCEWFWFTNSLGIPVSHNVFD